MPTIDQYGSRDAFLRVLLQGPPKTGKTCLACHFPKPWVIDLDVNLAGPIDHLRETGAPLPVGYDRVDVKPDGTVIAPNLQYLELDRVMIEAAKNPAVETIIIDSATKLVDIMMAEVLRQQNKTQVDRQMWGFFFALGKKFCSTLANYRKHIVLIAHERVEKDEMEQVLKYNVAWPGQLGDIIGAFFTDVWRCEVASTGGLSPTYKWNVRTMPDHRFNLGNSLKLPPLFEFRWSVVQEKLDRMKGVTK